MQSNTIAISFLIALQTITPASNTNYGNKQFLVWRMASDVVAGILLRASTSKNPTVRRMTFCPNYTLLNISTNLHVGYTTFIEWLQIIGLKVKKVRTLTPIFDDSQKHLFIHFLLHRLNVLYQNSFEGYFFFYVSTNIPTESHLIKNEFFEKC